MTKQTSILQSLSQRVKSAFGVRLTEILRPTITSETQRSATFVAYQNNSESYGIFKVTPDCSSLDSFGLPIPPRNLWVGYGKTADEYLSSGIRHFRKMRSILQESGYSFKEGDRILDFGCAAGRMIRQLNDFASMCEILGVDVNAERIVWCKQHLSPPFKFVTTTMLPHLPFEDNYFDLIYAGSVFTHIDDLADAWFLELRRILVPRGRLYVTVHDNNTIDIVVNKRTQDPSLSQYEFSQEVYERLIKPHFAMFTMDRSTGPHVFYDIEYLCQTLKPFYNILSITNEAYGYQTALLLQKP